MAAARGPVLVAAEVRITRTALGDGTDAPLEENVGRATPRRIIGLQHRGAQSLGNGEVTITLRNDDWKANAWNTGDGMKVEARAYGKATWTTIVDGCLGPIHFDPAGGRPTATVTVRSWSFLLDLISLPADKTYQSTAWTSIADDLITTTLGAGFPRTITADASTPTTVMFQKGMKLREALDVCRRALNAGADKWEHVVDVVAAAKTYLLYKRAATVQRTITRNDLLPGSGLDKGDVAEVVNYAIVTGGTVPTQIEDRTTATRAGAQRPALTTYRIAQPFIARDTPLSSIAIYGDRSVAADPPTLSASIARNWLGRDILRRGAAAGLLAFRTHASMHDEAASALDLNDATVTETVTVVATTTTELFAIDFGAGTPPTILGMAVYKSFSSNLRILVDYSDDDGTYTNAFTGATGSVAYEQNLFAAAQTHRYWRVRAQDTAAAGGTALVRAFTLLVYKNVGADATNPVNCQDLDTNSSATTTSSTGAVQKELIKFDLGATPTALAKLDLRHSESAASSLVTLKVQKSDDAAAWTDLAILDSTTSIVVDTIYLEDTAFRYLRVLVDDTRAGGSAAITTSAYEVNAYPHTTTPPMQPLVGDAMKGSSQSWDVSSLVQHPGTLEERSYPNPRLAIVKQAYYWLVLSIGSATTIKSWWDLDYSCSLSLANLSLYWGFEEGTGTTCYDGGPNQLNGTLTAGGSTPNNLPEWITGQLGNGVYVGYANGGSNILAADTADTNPASALGISIYVRPATSGALNKQGILGKGNGNPGAYSYFIDTDGKQLFVYWTGGIRKTAKSNTALTAKAWNKVGVSYDGANVKFYLNGAPDGTVASTGAIDTKADNFRVGQAFDLGAVRSELIGGMDELYFFKRVPTDNEFATMHGYSSLNKARFSRDSGTTWSAFPADLLLKTRLEFNTHTLQGTAQDAASQATYASLVPGGILYGSISDGSLLTQDAVDAEAAALVQRRKTPPRRTRLVIPHDPTLLAGQRVTVEVEAVILLGLAPAATATALNLDVVQVDHTFGERPTTTLACDEYPINDGGAANATIAYATGGTI